MLALDRVLSRMDLVGGLRSQTADDAGDDGPRMHPGTGWDVGQLPARPMPYLVFPENPETVAVQRNREEFLSAAHQASQCRSERRRRHALTVTQGHGSPSRGNPYAPLGEVEDLQQQVAARASPIRVVYPVGPSIKGAARRAPHFSTPTAARTID